MMQLLITATFIYPTYGISLDDYALGTDYRNAEVNTDWQSYYIIKMHLHSRLIFLLPAAQIKQDFLFLAFITNRKLL
jgi:hypothetical protein